MQTIDLIEQHLVGTLEAVRDYKKVKSLFSGMADETAKKIVTRHRELAAISLSGLTNFITEKSLTQREQNAVQLSEQFYQSIS